MDAEIKVKFVCGCGYTTPDMLQAVLHCEQTGHTLDAVGQIRPMVKRGVINGK